MLADPLGFFHFIQMNIKGALVVHVIGLELGLSHVQFLTITTAASC